MHRDSFEGPRQRISQLPVADTREIIEIGKQCVLRPSGRCPTIVCVAEARFRAAVVMIFFSILGSGNVQFTYPPSAKKEQPGNMLQHLLFRFFADDMDSLEQRGLVEFARHRTRPLFLHVTENPVSLTARGRWMQEFLGLVSEVLWMNPQPRRVTSALRMKLFAECDSMVAPLIEDEALKVLEQIDARHLLRHMDGILAEARRRYAQTRNTVRNTPFCITMQDVSTSLGLYTKTRM